VAEESNHNGITVKTPFGPITARGTAVFIAVGLAALGGLNYQEMMKRSEEHKNLEVLIRMQTEALQSDIRFSQCQNRLTLYQQSLGLKGEWIDLSRMPVDLYYCLPRFLTEKAK